MGRWTLSSDPFSGFREKTTGFSGFPGFFRLFPELLNDRGLQTESDLYWVVALWNARLGAESLVCASLGKFSVGL